VDNLHYYGYPASCPENTPSTGPSNKNIIIFFNVVIATVRNSSLRKLTKFGDDCIHGNMEESGKPGYDPVASVLGLIKDARSPNPESIRK